MPTRISSSSSSLTCVLVALLLLADLGGVVAHLHETDGLGPSGHSSVGANVGDCAVDHARHEPSNHQTPIDEPHVEEDADLHQHGCVACQAQRVRLLSSRSPVHSVLARGEMVVHATTLERPGPVARDGAPRAPPAA